MKGIVVIGAGGHAKIVLEILRAMGAGIACCVADEGAEDLGVTVLKGDHHLAKLFQEGHTLAIIAVGSNALRVKLAGLALAAGFNLVSAISPHAIVSPTARLGKGIVLMPGAIINAGAFIEDLAIINSGAVVEHDCLVGYGAHLGPLGGIAGNVTVGKQAFLGIGAKVIPGVSIGANATVGAGAVVIADVPADAVAVGVPARVIKSSRAS